jgi:hypothetical protein
MTPEKYLSLSHARADWLRVQCEVAYVRVLIAAQSVREALLREEVERTRAQAERDCKYSPGQPRVPAGQTGGGQWTGGGTGDASSGGEAVDVLDAGNGSDLLTLVLDPGSGGNGGGDGPNGCAAALAACKGYAMRLFDLGYEQDSFVLRQSCFTHTNRCLSLDARVQSSDPTQFGLSLFPPDYEKGGGGVVLHMYGKTPVYIPPATDPWANIPPAK